MYHIRSVNATARDFHGCPGEMSFARLVLSTSSVAAMHKLVKNVLPQRHEITPLIEHYLVNIHVLYPFLSESKLFQSIDAVYQVNGRDALPIDRWTVRLVLATAAASLSRKRGDTKNQDAVHHAVAALEDIETVVHPGSIAGVQAILQLVIYAMLDPRHFNGWYLIGLASRVMVDLGLHQAPPKELCLKSLELDMRLRIYDCVYALDRSVTLPLRSLTSFSTSYLCILASTSGVEFRVTSVSTSARRYVLIRNALFEIRHFPLLFENRSTPL